MLPYTRPSHSDPNDYTEITDSNNPLVPFTSDPSTHRQCFDVTIIDDGLLEDTERFNLSLTIAGNSTVPVVVDPAFSEVEIIDEDCKSHLHDEADCMVVTLFLLYNNV